MEEYVRVPPPVNTRVLQLPLAGQPLLLSPLLYESSRYIYIYVRALSWAIDEKGGSCSIVNKGTDCAEFESRLSTRSFACTEHVFNSLGLSFFICKVEMIMAIS